MPSSSPPTTSASPTPWTTFGGVAVMTRADHATGTDRLAEVAPHLECEIVVNVQGDEPLIAPDAIDAAVAPLLDRHGDLMATLRKRVDDPADLTIRAS